MWKDKYYDAVAVNVTYYSLHCYSISTGDLIRARSIEHSLRDMDSEKPKFSYNETADNLVGSRRSIRPRGYVCSFGGIGWLTNHPRSSDMHSRC